MPNRREDLAKIARTSLTIICSPVLVPLACLYDRAASSLGTSGHRSEFFSSNKRPSQGEGHHAQELNEKGTRKEMPTPLLPRKRALTLPLPAPGEEITPPETTQHTNEQSLSAFFGLPLEIREVIYTYALTAKYTHIFRTGERLYHRRCDCEHRELHPLTAEQDRRWDGECEASPGICEPELLQYADKGNILPLLRTCRKVYSEAVDLLYRRTIFCFQDPRTLEIFSLAILPQRIKLIKELELLWIDSNLVGCPFLDALATRIICSMTSLRSLNAVVPGPDVDRYQRFFRSLTHADVIVNGYDEGHTRHARFFGRSYESVHYSVHGSILTAYTHF